MTILDSTQVLKDSNQLSGNLKTTIHSKKNILSGQKEMGSTPKVTLQEFIPIHLLMK